MTLPDAAIVRRRPPSVFGVVGEVFITAGVLVLFFLVWQLWFNDLVVGGQQQSAAAQLEQEWNRGEGSGVRPTPSDPDVPPVTAMPAVNATFATLIVPRLGADYNRPIGQGVAQKVLNNSRVGIGHYVSTQLPGELGNFALAAHRSAYGGGFHNLNQLVIGDSIYVATPDGWYRYVYRSTEFVRATGIGVLAAVPQSPESTPTQSVITLTTCNPLFSTAERLVAYGVFDRFYPRSGGAPDEIAALVQAGA
jgi:sortase A